MRKWLLVFAMLNLMLVLASCQDDALDRSGSSEEPDVGISANVDSVKDELSVKSVPEPELIPEPVEETEPVPESLAPQPRLTQEDVDQALEAVMSNYSASAVAVAAIENGQVTQSGAWGWAVKNEHEMTADTKMWAASLTKVAVGMCALAMTEDGLLDLDAPLSTYWGSGVVNPYSKGQPSARTLMSHSSSLKALDVTYGLSKLRGLLQSSSSWRNMEPGGGGYWYYSNFGFCVLGTTLELAADEVLDDYLQERFLQPLGVHASLFGGNLNAEELACIYNTSGGVELSVQKQSSWKTPAAIGGGAYNYAGGLTISAVDLAKLVAILAGDGSYDGQQFLSPESVAMMEEPQFTVDPGDTTPFEQCLVLRRQEDIMGQSVLYYHTGSAYGAFNLLSYNPETGNGVVVLTIGTARKVNDRGLYALCADLSAEPYARMEETE